MSLPSRLQSIRADADYLTQTGANTSTITLGRLISELTQIIEATLPPTQLPHSTSWIQTMPPWSKKLLHRHGDNHYRCFLAARLFQLNLEDQYNRGVAGQ